MNSGLAGSDIAAGAWIRPEDERHKYHLQLIRRLLQGLDLSQRRVLDVGSGRGGNCHYLSRYTDVRRACGLDSSAGNALSSLRHVDALNADFVCGDAAALPFAGNTFDVALNIEWSPTYPELALLLREISRVLKPGGVFVYMDLWNDRARDPVWRAKRAAVHEAPLTVIGDEDITEEVFEALDRPDGLEAILRTVETDANRALVRRILEDAAATRASLAVGFYRARIIRFMKPAQEGVDHELERTPRSDP